jgi:hypothetical protein
VCIEGRERTADCGLEVLIRRKTTAPHADRPVVGAGMDFLAELAAKPLFQPFAERRAA